MKKFAKFALAVLACLAFGGCAALKNQKSSDKFIVTIHTIDTADFYTINTNDKINRRIKGYRINHTSITSVFSLIFSSKMDEILLVIIFALARGATLTKDT